MKTKFLEYLEKQFTLAIKYEDMAQGNIFYDAFVKNAKKWVN